MKYKIIDGNEACAYISYMFTEIAGIYPITPATPMAKHIEEYSNSNIKNIFNDKAKIIEMQSEKGAIALIHGAAQSGSIASSYTSSQGLLLMLPNMYKIAGEMLPCVINVASRTVATHALSIFGDHSDIYAARPTGFSFLVSSNVQDVIFMTLLSYLSTIKSSIPFLNIFDGFRSSHELNKIKVLELEEVKSLVDFKSINNFKERSIAIKKQIKGTNQNDDVYFQNLEARNKDYDQVPEIVNFYMEKINKKFNTNYHPFDYYGKKDAIKIIVAMGSICDSIKELIDSSKEKIGLIEVHLYRPFSEKYFLEVLPNTVKKVAVLDKTKEPGSTGEPLYLDVVNILNKLNKDYLIVGGRYGISSKNTDLEDIYAVYKNLDSKNPINSFTIGIIDDVTNKSLKKVDLNVKENKNNIEILIYGYGSDGMVSASKNMIKMIGENTQAFVQGYFRYDSKKSGGLTISNLRIGKEEIKMSYYIKNPHIIVCTNDFYLYKYDILENIRKNGIFILVTNKDIDDLPDKIKYIVKEKNIKFYTIDAYKMSVKYNIPNKINYIVECAIMYITKLLPYESFLEKIKIHIKNDLKIKGESVIENNINALEEVQEIIKEIDVKEEWSKIILKKEKESNFLEKIGSLKGYDLKVSDFIRHKDGYFEPNTSVLEKSSRSRNLPNWKSDTCIQCNKCAIVCPHGVITPKILTSDEVIQNDNIICVDLMGKEGYKFALEINYDKCTGCGLCESICTGKRGLKAIEIIDSKNSKKINSKINSTEKNIFDESTIKGVGFKTPRFRYSSACAGCGQTSYIKLLTQIFQDGIIISNSTGCSSIYGGDLNNPYNISWTNSLFEDNAEYGFGVYQTIKLMQEKIENIMIKNMERVNSKNKYLFNRWLENKNSYKITKEVMDSLEYEDIPSLVSLKNYISTKSVWMIGGDGWSYDIDFDGIDQVMSSNENINILVLDTEVYSNTGGQASKSTKRGAVAEFTKNGKKNQKKDLARMMMCYDNVYVATISLGMNIMQAIKTFKEAQKFDGPSLIIAYSPCISHGIKGGMKNTLNEERLAVQSGYFPLFRYDGKLHLDYSEPDFTLYEKFLENENRYESLNIFSKSNAKELLAKNKTDAINRFNYYKELSKK